MEHLLARLFPEREVPDTIRPLGPAPSPALALATALPSLVVTIAVAAAPPLSSENVDPPVQRVDAPRPAPQPVPPPDRFEIRFTAKADTVEKLKMVQDLLSHAVPNGDLAEVVDRALTVFAEQLVRKKPRGVAREST